MSKRSYNQYCAIARALDVIGHRWTLLLIRELMTGPKRFSDLMDHLPGIGTNLLSSRLKELEDQELAVQRKLPPPAASVVYELTERGLELESTILALAEWGRPLLGIPSEKDNLSSGWLMLAMKKSFRPEEAKGLEECYEFRIDRDVFQVRVTDGKIEVEQGVRYTPDMQLTSPSTTLMSIVAGELPAKEALQKGLIQVEGNIDALYRTFALFGVPVG